MPEFAQDKNRSHRQLEDRRAESRIAASQLFVSIKIKGKFGRSRVHGIDFSRHGMAIVVEKGLQKDKIVYLNLALGHLSLTNLVGVIHNCCKLAENSYRCGIRFRPQSTFQFDQSDTEATLMEFENFIQNTEQPPS